MSIIVKPNINIRGGSSKGFPPNEVTIIDHTANDGSVWIKWSDPEDTIVDNVIISQWKGTLLVRNDNHYPESSKDGSIVYDTTIRNQYKDVWFKDTGLTNNHAYYYRFFTYSTEDIYDNSSNTVFKEIPVEIAPIFSNNTWDQINKVIESGNIPSTWNIGDEIDIKLEGDINEDVTLQIWDFNHFDKTDGSGKARIVLGCKYLMSYNYTLHESGSFSDGWVITKMRSIAMNSIFNSIKTELSNLIKEVIIPYNRGSDYNEYTTNDKIFLPSRTEVGVESSYSYGEITHTKFPIFTNNTSRKKDRKIPIANVSKRWWTRTCEGYYWGYIDENGNYQSNITALSSLPIVFCFCI